MTPSLTIEHFNVIINKYKSIWGPSMDTECINGIACKRIETGAGRKVQYETPPLPPCSISFILQGKYAKII